MRAQEGPSQPSSSHEGETRLQEDLPPLSLLPFPCRHLVKGLRAQGVCVHRQIVRRLAEPPTVPRERRLVRGTQVMPSEVKIGKLAVRAAASCGIWGVRCMRSDGQR